MANTRFASFDAIYALAGEYSRAGSSSGKVTFTRL